VNEQNRPRFEVLSGPYCGLTGTAEAGPTLIGSGLDADFVFVEQGLERHHLRVTPHCNAIEIEALASEIRVDGGENIAPNERVVVPLPAVIHAGAMSIRWSMEDSQPVRRTDRWRVSIVALALVLLSSITAGTISRLFVRTDSAASPSSGSSPAAAVAPRSALNAADAPTTVAAAERLQEEVGRAGLLNIKVGSGTGVVTANGTLAPASLAKWEEVQKWFDRQSNGAYTLVNAVAVREEKTPSSIAVQAVWRGSDPYLVISGQKYFVGALLNNGWTVNGIEEGRVLLSRNGQVAILPY